MPERFGNLIDGACHPPESGEWFADRNPAELDEIVAEFPVSGPSEAAQAARAAAEAQREWAALPAPARGEVLRRAAELLEARKDDVAADLTREEGKSLAESAGETARAVTILRYYAMQTMLPEGDVIPSSSAGTLLYTRRAPLGVCALITPWNFPIAIPAWKAAPALAFGNAVVLKPASAAPLTAWRLAECLQDAGMPKGVLNVLYGSAPVAEALCRAPEVAAISFTGSARVGRHIAAIAAHDGRKVQLEMGGVNAVVVLPDADLEQAVRLTVQGAFRSAGQKCTATSRAIVDHSIAPAFEQRLAEVTRSLKVGPGTDPGAYLGPLIDREARDAALAAVERAVSEGARLLCGGHLTGEPYERGAYMAPVVLADVRPDMQIAREEVFAPVLSILRADGLTEAIELANGVAYGLSASVFTRDLNAALTFADRVEAGMVRVNGETAGVEPQAPFGGMKASSSYSREQGLAAREFYTQTRTVAIERWGA